MTSGRRSRRRAAGRSTSSTPTRTRPTCSCADQYEKVKAVFEASGEIDPRDAYPHVEAVMHEDDAHDPTLAHYQQFPRNQA